MTKKNSPSYVIANVVGNKSFHNTESTIDCHSPKGLRNDEKAVDCFEFDKSNSRNDRGAETQEPDIILDFFAGSGTTAHALMQLNAEDGGNRKELR